MTDLLRDARTRLHWLSSVEALIEARQRDAELTKRYGRHTTESVDQLEAAVAHAQLELAYQTSAAADVLLTLTNERT